MRSNLTPQAKPSKAFEVTRRDNAAAREFLKEHIAYPEIINMIRGRFKEIFELLKEVGINKHDLSHQLRTAFSAINIMRELGPDYFSHREVVMAGAAATFHDIAYNRPSGTADETGYNAGKKGDFKNHAPEGADEVKAYLTEALEKMKQAKDQLNPEIAQLRKILTYKNENGESKRINDQDIDDIWGSIFHHNDYGKDKAEYNPWLIKNMMLMVQLCDKLDISRQRVYPEHMAPEDFVPTEKRTDGQERDEKFIHRSVPYCINEYSYVVNAQNGRMTWKAHVDLEKFNTFMKDHHSDFYDPDSFAEDFHRAYEKNARVAAEAFGKIMHRVDEKDSLSNQTHYLDSHSPLVVELDFGNGEKRRLYYRRPEREIYKIPSLTPWQEKLSALQAAQVMHLVDDEAVGQSE